MAQIKGDSRKVMNQRIPTKDIGNKNFPQDPKGTHDGEMPRIGNRKVGGNAGKKS